MIGLFLGLPAISLQGSSPLPEMIRPWIFFSGMMFPWLIVFPLGRVQSHLRRLKMVSKSSNIFVFSGVISPHPQIQHWFKKLIETHELLTDGKTSQSIEVFSQTDTVTGRAVILRVNEKAVREFKLARMGATTETGSNQMMAPIASFVINPTQKILNVEQRHLNSTEKTELKGVIQRSLFGKLPEQLIIQMILFFLIGFISPTIYSPSYDRHLWDTHAAIYGSIPLFAWFCVLRYRTSVFGLKLRKDFLDGRVRVLSIADPEKGEEEKVELLMQSKSVWAVGSTPAAWRVYHGANKIKNPSSG